MAHDIKVIKIIGTGINQSFKVSDYLFGFINTKKSTPCKIIQNIGN